MTRVSMSSPSLRARCAQQLEHRGRLVGRQHPGATSGGGNGKRAASGRDVEEPHARAKPGPAQALVSQPHLRRRVGPVVARCDLVPRGPRILTGLNVHGFLLATVW